MKYVVLKTDDVSEHLTSDEIESLRYILRAIEVGRITEGKKPRNNYIVVNMDEPYADKVKRLIEKNEGKEICG